MPAHRVLLVVAALLGAGCVSPGLSSEPLDASAVSAASPAVATTAVWADAGGAESFPIGPAITIGPEAKGLFIDAVASLGGPRGLLEIHARSPSGVKDAILVMRGPLFASDGVVRSDWTLLSAEPGEWTFEGFSNVPTAGVLNVTAVAARDLRSAAGDGPDRVVVAVVDTGVDPYHEVFQNAAFAAGALPAHIVDADNGVPPLVVPLSRGQDHLASLRADAGVWSAVPGKTLVHFEGTNLLGYSVDGAKLPRIPILDRDGHGTAVSHAVVRENPDVLVVMVTGDDYAARVEWVAGQPWIDILSMSWGPVVNAAGPAFGALGTTTPTATRGAHDEGKAIFGASGNDPTPTFTDTTSGPLWVHAVSGSLPQQGGRATRSGNFVDTVANWSQELAVSGSLDKIAPANGTSFATPTTAGIASRILHDARLRAGHQGGIADGALVRAGDVVITSQELRDALNATAFYWETAGYRPHEDALPIAPAPWVSMGWGHVDGSIVPLAVDVLLGAAASPPEKPAEAQAWMSAWAQARERSWS